MAKVLRAAQYLRVSGDSQTAENPRIVLTKLAKRRGFDIAGNMRTRG
jgi:DNA invertase Pin-like site-specific DNA recombinase